MCVCVANLHFFIRNRSIFRVLQKLSNISHNRLFIRIPNINIWNTNTLLSYGNIIFIENKSTHLKKTAQLTVHLHSTNTHLPAGSSSLGMWSSLSAMWKASSKFCLFVLVRALVKSTTFGLRAWSIAKNTTPLLQLTLKSFTFRVQPALRRQTKMNGFIVQNLTVPKNPF